MSFFTVCFQRTGTRSSSARDGRDAQLPRRRSAQPADALPRLDQDRVQHLGGLVVLSLRLEGREDFIGIQPIYPLFSSDFVKKYDNNKRKK